MLALIVGILTTSWGAAFIFHKPDEDESKNQEIKINKAQENGSISSNVTINLSSAIEGIKPDSFIISESIANTDSINKTKTY